MARSFIASLRRESQENRRDPIPHDVLISSVGRVPKGRSVSPEFEERLLLVLGASGSKSVQKMLIALLADPDVNVRWLAVYSISRMGPNARETIPDLIDALEDDTISVYVEDALAKIGGEELFTQLEERFDRETSRVRSSILSVLAATGHNSQRGLGLVIRALDDPDGFVSAGAIYALGEYGANGDGVMPKLEEMAKQDAFTKATVARTLWLISGDAEKSVSLLIEILQGSDDDACLLATQILTRMNGDAVSALPALYLMLERSDNVLRETAAEAIAHIEAALTH